MKNISFLLDYTTSSQEGFLPRVPTVYIIIICFLSIGYVCIYTLPISGVHRSDAMAPELVSEMWGVVPITMSIR